MAPNSMAVIDNLAIAAFEPLLAELTARHAVVLNHHPTGLEPGLAPETAAALISLEQRIMPQLHHVVVTSPTTGETIARQFGVANTRILNITPGTDDAPPSAGSDGEIVHVLSIGSLIPRKGHDVLMRAMAKLFDLNWRLTIAGGSRLDPAYAAWLHTLPTELGIADRITFCGEMSGQPLVDLWNAADIFALATNYEGYGMVIAEALKRGLPVVVCNGGAAGALITGMSGVVCPVGDDVQFSKAIRRIIFDTKLREDMAKAALQTGLALPNWAAQAQAFLAAFN
jgi:glycosyltransferase involved in cell wall biosynthesis